MRPVTKGERETIERFVSKNLKTKFVHTHLFISKDAVFVNKYNLGPLMKYFFFVHAGAKIGTLKGNVFSPTQHMYWYIEDTLHLPILSLTREEYSLLCDKKPVSRSEEKDGYYALCCGRGVL